MLIYIHIGFPKTATTTLQSHFFSRLPGINYVGFPDSEVDDNLRKFIETITDAESLEYSESEVKEYLNHLINDSQSWPVLLSEETLSTGSFLSGRVSRLEIAKRLCSLFPKAKIIVTIREQSAMLKSFYLQMQKQQRGCRLDLHEWIAVQSNRSHRENVFMYFDYDKILKVYEELFGAENVTVLLFEEFKSDPERYLATLRSLFPLGDEKFWQETADLFSSQNENRTITKGDAWLNDQVSRYGAFKSLVPKYIKRQIRKFTSNTSSVEIEFTAEELAIISERYRISNLELMNRHKLNLKHYGYSC